MQSNSHELQQLQKIAMAIKKLSNQLSVVNIEPDKLADINRKYTDAATKFNNMDKKYSHEFMNSLEDTIGEMTNCMAGLKNKDNTNLLTSVDEAVNDLNEKLTELRKYAYLYDDAKKTVDLYSDEYDAALAEYLEVPDTHDIVAEINDLNLEYKEIFISVVHAQQNTCELIHQSIYANFTSLDLLIQFDINSKFNLKTVIDSSQVVARIYKKLNNSDYRLDRLIHKNKLIINAMSKIESINCILDDML